MDDTKSGRIDHNHRGPPSTIGQSINNHNSSSVSRAQTAPNAQLFNRREKYNSLVLMGTPSSQIKKINLIGKSQIEKNGVN